MAEDAARAELGDAVLAAPAPLAPPTSALDVPVVVPLAAPAAPSASEPTELVVEPPALEVTVRSQRSEARKLQESAEAVNVLDLRRARQRSADLGEVLSRTQGVNVRRLGGLGSDARVSMNGLEGDQIRLYLDGVPLELSGFPFGISNIPVNLLERVEVYRGVVPIRFGADALGGAINLVTDQSYETHGTASYEVGSFGTHRVAAIGRYHHDRSGFVAGVNTFFDYSKNDYVMSDRPLATEDGGTIIKDLKRFHDAYRAYGVNLELGVIDKSWARRLVLNGFFSSFDKDLQHNAIMTIPYGAITYGETTGGVTARYELDLPKGVDLTVLASYARRRIDFEDLSPVKYLWTGERGMPVGRGRARGELSGSPSDQSLYENGFLARIQLGYKLSPEQALRLAATPHVTTRTGESHLEDRIEDAELELDNLLSTLVLGLEHQLDLFAGRLSNVVFGKYYYLAANTEELDRLNYKVVDRHERKHQPGVGDSLRYRFNNWALAKASYEYATRLPTPNELFGNGVLVSANVKLKPEVSHNLNVGPRFDAKRTRVGAFMLDLNLFMRDTHDVIILLGGKQFIPYQNIGNARGLGVESAASWASPGRWLNLDGTFTYQDLRSTSTSGPYAAFKGQRIPSRPYMFASWGATIRIPNLPGRDDTLEPFYAGRYTHGYKRGWDVGDPQFFIRLPSMISHDVGVSWVFTHTSWNLASTFTISNLTDARLYDTFGVQRPGRAYYLKLSGQI